MRKIFLLICLIAVSVLVSGCTTSENNDSNTADNSGMTTTDSNSQDSSNTENTQTNSDDGNDRTTCTECGGTGICWGCNGEKIIDGETCQVCMGTGVCPACNGDGWVPTHQ